MADPELGLEEGLLVDAHGGGGHPVRVFLSATEAAPLQWLSHAGPSSCSLWVDLAVDRPHLFLACRLLSCKPFFLPLLDRAPVAISLFGSGSGSRSGSGSGLAWRRAKSFLKPGSNWAVKWLLWLPSSADHAKLLRMLAPHSGVLWEFRRLLLRIIHMRSFVDTGIQVVDFPDWLDNRQHRCITLLEASDLYIVWRSRKWIVIRFDLAEGHLKSARGECLGSLMCFWGTQTCKPDHEMKILWAAASRRMPNADDCFSLQWELCQSPSPNRDPPPDGVLIDFLSACDDTEDFRDDFSGFWCEPDLPVKQFGSGLKVWDIIQSCFPTTGAQSLTSKELCALSNLGSGDSAVRQRGLQILVDIFWKELKGGAMEILPGQHNLPSSPTSLTPDGFEFLETSTAESSSSEETSGKCPTRQTHHHDGPIRAEILHEAIPTEKNAQRDADHKTICNAGHVLYVTDGSDFAPGGLQINQMRLLEWVRHGFLEGIFKETILGSGKEAEMFGIQGTADICLKITDMVLGESISCLVGSLVFWLKDCLSDNVLVTLSNHLHAGGKDDSQGGSSGLVQPKKQRRPAEKQAADMKNDKLTDTVLKVWRLSKLLSLLLCQSTFIASAMVESGGLGLLLELYTVLARGSVLNYSNLGYVLSGPHASKSKEEEDNGLLPGKVLQQQKRTTKVFPLFGLISQSFGAKPNKRLLKLMESGIASEELQAIIRDLSLTSRMKKVILGTQGSLASRFLKGFLNLANVLGQEIESAPILPRASWGGNIAKENGNVLFSEAVLHSDDDDDNPPQKFFAESEASVIYVPTHESLALDWTSAGNGRSSIVAETKQGRVSFHKSSRPAVPKLALNFSADPKCAPAKKKGDFMNEQQKTLMASAAAVMTFSPLKSSRASDSLSRSSSADYMNLISEAKQHLLQALVSMLRTTSFSSILSMQSLKSKNKIVNGEWFLSSFVTDLIGCFSNDFLGANRKLEHLIFQVVLLLDCNSPPKLHSCADVGKMLPKDFVLQNGYLESSCSYGLLGEALKQLQTALSYQAFCLQKEVQGLAMAADPSQLPISDSPMHTRKSAGSKLGNVSLGVWRHISIILTVLADFILFWPKSEASSYVLKTCGEQFDTLLGLLHGLKHPTSWNFPKMLAMQGLLNILIVAFHDRVKSNTQWTEFEESLWDLVINNPRNWGCIKSYLNWLLLEASHGCISSLYRIQQGFHPEFCEFRQDSPSMTDAFMSYQEFQCFEIVKTAFDSVRIMVLILQRRLDAPNHTRSSVVSLWERNMCFLMDFLMNPVDGLLMKVLKGPFFYGKTLQTHRESGLEGVKVPDPSEHPLMLKHRLNSEGKWSKFSATTTPSPSSENICPTSRSDMSSTSCYKMGFLCGCPQGLLSASSGCYKTSGGRKLRRTMTFPSNPWFSCSQRVFDAREGDSSMRRHSLLPWEPDSECFCNSCGEKTWCRNLSSGMSCLIELESTHLLAQFFSMKFRMSLKNDNGSHIADEMPKNPFLSHKYVNPFLDYHFLCFLQIYYMKANTNCKDEEAQLLGIATTLAHTASKGHRLSKLVPAMLSFDDHISEACLRHGSILLTLSQNQTACISLRFKQLKVMEFLVHQIALEYEASHVASPKESSSDSNSNKKGVIFENPGSSGLSNGPGFRGNGEWHSLFDWEGKFAKINEESIVQDKSLPDFSQFYKLQNRQRSPSSRIYKSLPVFEYPQNEFFKFCHTVPGTPTMETEWRADNQRFKIARVWSGHSCSYLSGEGYGHFPLNNYGSELLHLTKTDFAEKCETGNNEGDGSLPRKSSGLQKPKQNLLQIIGSETMLTPPSANCDMSKRCTYDGQFFDLNEVVEQELAEEENSGHRNTWTSSISLCGSLEREGDNGLGITQNKPSNFSIIMKEEHSSVLDIPTLDMITNLIQSPLSSDDRCNLSKEPKQAALFIRPAVPKLNLPKSARKGEQDSNSKSKSLDREVAKLTPAAHIDCKLHMLDETCQVKSSESLLNRDISGRSDKALSTSYESERSRRRMYRNAKLHVLFLELFVSLMLTPGDTLEACYSDRFPMEGSKLNAPFYLLYHLNHVANAGLLPYLSKRLKSYQLSAFRILKLTWRALFNPSLYTNRQRIAHGAFAQVYTADTISPEGKISSVVLKTVDLPKGPHDPCKFIDVYSEVEILEKFSGEPRVCQLLDYGVDLESFVLVLKHYKTSLKYWREKHNMDLSIEPESDRSLRQFYKRLPLYLEVYASVLQAVKVLEAHNVVHYDLKCDNILLEPIEASISEGEFWDPPVWPKKYGSHNLPFSVCIADFGQSKASFLQGGECTFRNRGTEYVKSPEMLKLMSSRHRKVNTSLNKNEADGSVGKAVDVWGLGCLLYELLTGEYLLYDEDWTRFFVRVTLSSEELISDEKAAKVDHYEPIMDFLHFVLVRDPVQRPTLDDVISRIHGLQSDLKTHGFSTGRCSACCELGSGSSQSNHLPLNLNDIVSVSEVGAETKKRTQVFSVVADDEHIQTPLDSGMKHKEEGIISKRKYLPPSNFMSYLCCGCSCLQSKA